MPMRGRNRRSAAAAPTPAVVSSAVCQTRSARSGPRPIPRSTAMTAAVAGQKSQRGRPSPRVESQIARCRSRSSNGRPVELEAVVTDVAPAGARQRRREREECDHDRDRPQAARALGIDARVGARVRACSCFVRESGHGPRRSYDAPTPISEHMRVLFVSWKDLAHPQAGGAEYVTDRLATGLQARGHEVALLAGGPVGQREYPVFDAGGTYSQYLRAPFAYRKRFRDWDLVVDVENGVPFFSPLWRKGPVVCLVHHVHVDQWSMYFAPPIAATGPDARGARDAARLPESAVRRGLEVDGRESGRARRPGREHPHDRDGQRSRADGHSRSHRRPSSSRSDGWSRTSASNGSSRSGSRSGRTPGVGC